MSNSVSRDPRDWTLLENLYNTVINDISMYLPDPRLDWLCSAGFHPYRITPVYLLAFLATSNLAIPSYEQLQCELFLVVGDRCSEYYRVLRAICYSLRADGSQSGRYELGGFENVFTREGNLLETILLDTNLSILMIGETPNLSSALGIIGLRGTTHNLRATCFGSPGKPIRAVLRDQMRRIKKESLEWRRLRTVSNDEAQDFSSFNYFSRSRIAQDFDAIEPDTYASLHFPYDIVFGHCLYPHSNWVCQDPSHLLANVLRAVSIASDERPDPKPVLVILTIPDSHWRDQYKLPEVIEQYKDRFQYLGGNRLVEETLLKFGYWHEKGADRAGRNPHSLHNHVASNLVAHVFVTRGRMREGILS